MNVSGIEKPWAAMISGAFSGTNSRSCGTLEYSRLRSWKMKRLNVRHPLTVLPVVSQRPSGFDRTRFQSKPFGKLTNVYSVTYEREEI